MWEFAHVCGRMFAGQKMTKNGDKCVICLFCVLSVLLTSVIPNIPLQPLQSELSAKVVVLLRSTFSALVFSCIKM